MHCGHPSRSLSLSRARTGSTARIASEEGDVRTYPPCGHSPWRARHGRGISSNSHIHSEIAGRPRQQQQQRRRRRRRRWTPASEIPMAPMSGSVRRLLADFSPSRSPPHCAALHGTLQLRRSDGLETASPPHREGERANGPSALCCFFATPQSRSKRKKKKKKRSRKRKHSKADWLAGPAAVARRPRRPRRPRHHHLPIPSSSSRTRRACSRQ